jgi:hypothetical protein
MGGGGGASSPSFSSIMSVSPAGGIPAGAGTQAYTWISDYAHYLIHGPATDPCSQFLAFAPNDDYVRCMNQSMLSLFWQRAGILTGLWGAARGAVAGATSSGVNGIEALSETSAGADVFWKVGPNSRSTIIFQEVAPRDLPSYVGFDISGRVPRADLVTSWYDFNPTSVSRAGEPLYSAYWNAPEEGGFYTFRNHSIYTPNGNNWGMVGLDGKPVWTPNAFQVSPRGLTGGRFGFVKYTDIIFH